MPNQPTPDQERRAADLREQIERLKHSQPKPSIEDAAPTKKESLSPREYIEQRMRELDKRKQAPEK
jgi:hypothetical protein